MPLPNRLRFQILLRDGYTCMYCGAKPGIGQLEVDHIHPRVRGGKDDPENLLTSCIPCNRGKFTTGVLDGPSMEEMVARVHEVAPDHAICAFVRSRQEMVDTLLAFAADVALERVQDPKSLTEEEFERVTDAAGRLDRLPLYVKEIAS